MGGPHPLVAEKKTCLLLVVAPPKKPPQKTGPLRVSSRPSWELRRQKSGRGLPWEAGGPTLCLRLRRAVRPQVRRILGVVCCGSCFIHATSHPLGRGRHVSSSGLRNPGGLGVFPAVQTPGGGVGCRGVI